MSDEWQPIETKPEHNGPHLVLMPERGLDRYSVQFYHHIDGWSNDYGITHWRNLPPPPSA